MKTHCFNVALLIILAVGAVSGTASADEIPIRVVSITGGNAYTKTVTDSFSIFADNLHLWSMTPDGGEGSFFALTQTGSSFLFATTIRADPNSQGLGLPCSNSRQDKQSGGVFNGITAECLLGSITFTSSLTGPPCLSEGGCGGCCIQFSSSPFVASGNISGWDSLADDTSIKMFDISISGQGSASIGSGGPRGFLTEYDFGPTPEPSSLVLLGTGLLGILGVMRKKLLG